MEQEPEFVSKSGRKANLEKKIQASIYFMEDQIVEIDNQTGIRKKERDKSSLIRAAADIVLELSNEEYALLKETAASRRTTPGKIVREALRQYLM